MTRAVLLLTAAVGGLLLACPAGAAPGPVSQAEGSITAVSPGAVTVATGPSVQVRVVLTADTLIIQRKRVTLADIKPNDFVAVTARREADGSLTAISINIFPPEFKDRVRQTQFVMETGNVMTNATVFMNVRRIEGRMLYLKLPDGSVVIAVPKEAEVFRLTLLKSTDLKAGMQVVVRGAMGADGILAATTIAVVIH